MLPDQHSGERRAGTNQPQRTSWGQDITPLNVDVLSRALRGHRIGWPLYYVERVSSTQDVARKLAQERAAEGVLVLAEEQTAGRGRAGRSWWAPAGTAILSSLLLRPSLAPQHLGYLGMIAGLAVVDALRSVGSIPSLLKWPNDILVQGKKVAGILVEIMWTGEKVQAVILGVGINVRAHIPANLPFAREAISLLDAGFDVSREDLVIAYVRAFETYYDRVLKGWSPVRLWARHLHTLGKRVRVVDSHGTWEGMAEDVSEDGALLVRQGTEVRVLRAADVRVRTVEEGL